MVAEQKGSSAGGGPSTAAVRRWRWPMIVSAAGIAVAAVVGLYVIFFGASPETPRHSPPADPRAAYTGPFRNIDPAVAYVSDARCGDCHAAIAASYNRHPMGRSLMPIAQAGKLPEDKEHNHPFEAAGSLFEIVHRDAEVRHRRSRLGPDGKPAAELEWPVHYVIGSGRRGHSYLTDHDGYLFQTPISWYSHKNGWGLSPSFTPHLLTGRPALPECLFCHANRTTPVEGSVHRYTQPIFDGHAIGCQRCHGPGALHVAGRLRQEPIDTIDYTILNPRHLDWSLREAVCEQCHLTGETRVARRGRGLYDFRPGLAMEQFWSVFVRPPDSAEGQKAVGHVEQIYQSQCAQRSAGAHKLGCISCHDPHRVVRGAERLTYYRQRCLSCHAQKGCTELPARREQKRDSCFECHMVRHGSIDVPHTATTDHRILRRDPPEPRRAVDGLPVVSFYRARKAADDTDEDRDLALALVKLARAGQASLRDVRHARRGLEVSLQRDPDDLVALEARAYALGLEDRWTEALDGFRQVLAKAPERELALVGAASMAEALGKTEPALAEWRRVVAANPWSAEYRRRLTLLLAKEHAWDEALTESGAWIRLDPMSIDARTTRLSALLALGRKQDARAEFARLEALTPPNLGELRIRFERKLK